MFVPDASFGAAPFRPMPFIVAAGLGGGGGEGAFSQPFEVALASDDRSGPPPASAPAATPCIVCDSDGCLSAGTVLGPLGGALPLFFGSSSGLS